MMDHSLLRIRRLGLALLSLTLAWIVNAPSLFATDYFLTIGGGYDREGNQASLEANVVFFQQVLADKHHGPRRHDIFFADGDDPAADLQIVAEKQKSAGPASDLIASLHRRRGEAPVAYRNHQVAEVAGPLNPRLIRGSLDSVSMTARSGDRLIVYVTAHGSAGPKEDPFNTTIDCWNNKKITAREFSEWLNKLPSEVPVVMVMAQCYCGGFGQTIFEGLDKQKGLTSQPRVGFFAQQHDLPAAGCRPDIEHDEEFSSYFFGALAGRSRNGVPIKDCDADGNGVISFSEAYAYAVGFGETIDVPLRTSEVLLRTYSRLTTDDAPDSAIESDAQDSAIASKPSVLTMAGKLGTIADRGTPVSRQIVTQLSRTLGFSLQDDVTSVVAVYEESRRASRPQGRGRSRQGSGRRELLQEVTEKWPELGDGRKWSESPLLKTENQDSFLAELKQLPTWKTFDERRQQMEAANQESDQQELRTVKFRKLIRALEAIVLENNLPLFATPQVLERYQQLLALEDSTLSPTNSDK